MRRVLVVMGCLALEPARHQNGSVAFDIDRAKTDMHDFTVLVLEGSYASSVAATVDVLDAARSLAPQAGVAPPRVRVCSIAGGPVPLQGGFTLQTTRLPVRERGDRSVWIIPGLGIDPSIGMKERLTRPESLAMAERVARHARQGGTVAASCVAVFLLREAGLLQGRRATTSWWFAPLLQRLAPACHVDADRMVCVDGGVVTAGAAFAQVDLMLHLLRERCGEALTQAVSRMLLIDGREAQAPFVMPEVLASGNTLVAQLAARIEAMLPRPPSVAVLAQEFCMSGRTLARHVHKATGKTPLALVQSVRLRRARTLLEGSRMTVDQVAAAVGYQDATALRRMMKKLAGAAPSRWRPATATSVRPARSR